MKELDRMYYAYGSNLLIDLKVDGSTNVFGTYVWDVLASNTFFYNSPRQVSVRLTADL